MKPKFYIILTIILIAVIAGCATQPEEEKRCSCPKPKSWSVCSDEAVKTRTNYRCGSETNFTCEEYVEEEACLTEINMRGRRGMEARVSPTIEENVKGLIKVEALKVPEGTEMVKFIFVPSGVQLGPNMAEEDFAKIIQEMDSDGADGWKAFFDTTKVENGLYQLNVLPTYTGAPDENPWLDWTQTQVIVKN